MESLKAILFHDYSIPKFLLRAKSLECMSSILLRMESLKFTKEDAVKVSISANSNCLVHPTKTCKLFQPLFNLL